MFFRDEDNNEYYTEAETLYCKIVRLGTIRKIGKISTNLNTGKCHITIHRSSQEKTNFGWMVSLAPLEYLVIDKVIIIQDNDHIYMLEWEKVKYSRKAWTFKPDNGMEKQIVLPDAHFTEIKQDIGIIV